MNNAMLNNTVLAADYSNLGGAFSPERLELAGQMTLLGMVMIFSVLGLLWGVLAIFQRIMTGKTEKNAPVTNVVSTPAPVAEAAPVAASNDDEIIAAVIAAAVAAYMADEGNTEAAYNGGFRVVSFRRVQGGKAWNSKH